MNIIQTLQHDLLAARKAKNRTEVQALQATLARITNAQAVASVPSAEPTIGVGSSEAPRRELTDTQQMALIKDELAELQEAYASMKEHAEHPYAAELKAKIHVLERYV